MEICASYKPRERKDEIFVVFIPFLLYFFCWGFFVCFWWWYLFILQRKAQILQFERSKAMGSLATQEKEGRKQKIFLVLTLFGLLNWTYVKILSYEREKMRFLLLFFPFFFTFLLGLFCLLLMMISIYSSGKGVDPIIWKIWSHGFSCNCSIGKRRKKEKKKIVLTPFVWVVKLDICQNFK